jgi:[protein-PII] uridylyltransferase
VEETTGLEARATQNPTSLPSKDWWRRVEEEFFATGQASSVQTAITQARDAICIEAYRLAFEPDFPESAAVFAAGPYGQGETFPYSAIDLFILVEPGLPPSLLKRAQAEFARMLWGAGLRLNSAVHDVAECLDAAAGDVEFGMNLLDRRFLAGDGAVAAKLESKLPVWLSAHGRDLSRRFCQLERTRHARFQNTPRHAQPDVEEAPGGLRDLRLIRRLAAFKPERESRGDALGQAAGLISCARCFLHYHAGSDCNVLDFGAQESLAHQTFAVGQTPAQWMREYFQRAREVFGEARRALDAEGDGHNSLIDSFREYRSRLSNSEFTVSRDRLLLRNPSQLGDDPMLVFRALQFIGRHGVAPAPETERRLAACRAVFAAYCARTQPLWTHLKAILSSPYPAIALRALDSAGLMPALFPEWSSIENLVIMESGHAYTADEQALMSIERVAALRCTADPVQQRFSEMLNEIDDAALLLFALLFIDIGLPAENHVRLAADRAREVMARIQMPAEGQDTVLFLIERQPDFSEAVSSRDLDNPATERLLAELAGTVERLKLLVMATYARVSAAGFEAGAPWRLEQLWRAYRLVRQELTRELETDRILRVPEDLPPRADFIKGFPLRYLRAHSHRDFEEHLQLFELSRPSGVAVRLDQIEGAYRLTVIAQDRPFLFASFAAAISSFGLNILKAEAFSGVAGIVLDTFVFADQKRTLQQNPPEMDRLRDLMQRVALGKTDAQRLMRSRPAPQVAKRAMPAQVQFDSSACETATLVEIEAEDRQGLLYSLAAVFSSNACNIDVVLIDTKGHRAIDVFYVAHEGQKLSPEMQVRLKEKLLAAC